VNAPAKFGPMQPSATLATALVRRAPAPSAIMRPQTVAELDIFAQRAARSGMVPPTYANKPEAIFIAVQMGSELGLSPMQSLSNIAVVNGRPSVWGDAMPGLCRQSSLCQDIKEWFTGSDETLTAHCEAVRIGAHPVLQEFSVADAKKAGLWGKSGPWTQYPRRMLQMRARGFALRDAFPDVLRGLISYEEAQDIPPDSFRGATLDGRPEPAATADTSAALDDAIPERVMSAPAPAAPPKRTIATWLAEMAPRLAAAPDLPALDAIVMAPEVKRVSDMLRNGALDEWEALLADNVARLHVPSDDPDGAADFPGDQPP
jgi:hypothetical protein